MSIHKSRFSLKFELWACLKKATFAHCRGLLLRGMNTIPRAPTPCSHYGSLGSADWNLFPNSLKTYPFVLMAEVSKRCFPKVLSLALRSWALDQFLLVSEGGVEAWADVRCMYAVWIYAWLYMYTYVCCYFLWFFAIWCNLMQFDDIWCYLLLITVLTCCYLFLLVSISE